LSSAGVVYRHCVIGSPIGRDGRSTLAFSRCLAAWPGVGIAMRYIFYR
jgi:hypothetical protein